MKTENIRTKSLIKSSKLKQKVQVANNDDSKSEKKPSLIKTSSAPEKTNPLKLPLLNDADKPFGTIENIEYMLKLYGVTVAYDVITKDIIITEGDYKHTENVGIKWGVL
jgi:hypothetical protein